MADAKTNVHSCVECGKTFDAEIMTCIRKNAHGVPYKWICKDCNRLRKVLRTTPTEAFGSKQDRVDFFGQAQGLDHNQMAQLASSKEIQKESTSTFQEDLTECPHYCKTDLEAMPRYQTEEGKACLKTLLENTDVMKILPLTGEKVWPLPNIKTQLAKRSNSQRDSEIEVSGEKKLKVAKAAAKAVSKDGAMLMPPPPKIPKAKALAKSLAKKGNDMLESMAEKGLKAATTIAAASDPDVSSYFAPMMITNLEQCRLNVANYHDALSASLSQTPPPSKDEFGKTLAAAKEGAMELQSKLDLARRRFLGGLFNHTMRYATQNHKLAAHSHFEISSSKHRPRSFHFETCTSNSELEASIPKLPPRSSHLAASASKLPPPSFHLEDSTPNVRPRSFHLEAFTSELRP